MKFVTTLLLFRHFTHIINSHSPVRELFEAWNILEDTDYMDFNETEKYAH